jgi:hypothetical protein
VSHGAQTQRPVLRNSTAEGGRQEAKTQQAGKWGKEDRPKVAHLAGEGGKQMKSLRLGTFAPLHWLNCVFGDHPLAASANPASKAGGRPPETSGTRNATNKNSGKLAFELAKVMGLN